MREPRLNWNFLRVPGLRCPLIELLLLAGMLAGAGFGSSGSTAQLQGATQEPAKAGAAATENPDDLEHMRQTIKRLTAENEKLKKRIAELEKHQHLGSVQDRLTNEEQRAENLQAQLLTAGEKDVTLQSRMDEINEQLRPENIDNLVINGSTRPEDFREATRRRLNNEKVRLQSQIDLLHQSRARLQSSLTQTDLTIQQLRLQLQQAQHPAP